MIKTILGHLEAGISKIESGQLSPEDMELLVEDAKELYERMVIMRYKIYETNVLGVSEPVVSASIRQPEIETPIDLFGAMDLTAEPEFEVTFAQEDPIMAEEKISYPLEEEEEEEESVFENTSFEEEPEVAQASFDAAPFEEEVSEELPNTEMESFEAETESEMESYEEDAPQFNNSDILVGEEVIENSTFEVEAEEESSIAETNEATIEEEPETHYEPHFSANQPIWMAEMEANIRDNRSVFPLDTLAGAFTLNEKLQFINELFDGSSDDFSSSVKQLDQLANMDAARNMLAELSSTFNWDTESEIVEDFLYKICRRHAAGN